MKEELWLALALLILFWKIWPTRSAAGFQRAVNQGNADLASSIGTDSPTVTDMGTSIGDYQIPEEPLYTLDNLPAQSFDQWAGLPPVQLPQVGGN